MVLEQYLREHHSRLGCFDLIHPVICHNVFVRLEKVESDIIVEKSVFRKEEKSTNEEDTRKKIIIIFNLKNKAGK